MLFDPRWLLPAAKARGRADLRQARDMLACADEGPQGICAIMALVAVQGVGRNTTASPAYAALKREMGGDIPGFHDSHSREENLAAFDRAIASLQ